MHHSEFSEKEIRMLIDFFENLKHIMLSMENEIKSCFHFKNNIFGFFMAKFLSLSVAYLRKYSHMDGPEFPPNINTGVTDIAVSFPEEIYKNFSEIRIFKLIEENKFNKNQIYIKLSFEKFYIRKNLLRKKYAYRAGITVEKIETPKDILDLGENFISGSDDRFSLATEKIKITFVENIVKGYLVSDNLIQILHDFGVAFADALSEETRNELFLVDEQSSINILESY